MLSSIVSKAAADPEELNFRREERSRFIRTFIHYPGALPALILFVIILLASIFAPLLTQYTPFEGSAVDRLLGIGTPGHLLGTDEQAGICSPAASTRAAEPADGFPARAHRGGDRQRAGHHFRLLWQGVCPDHHADAGYLLRIPATLLAIALSSVLGSGLSSIIIPIAVILVPPIARVAESTVQDIMPEDFIEAAQTSGPAR